MPMWGKVIIQSPHVSCCKIIEVRHSLQHWKIIVTKVIPFVSPQTFINPVLEKGVKLHSSLYIVPKKYFTVLDYIYLFLLSISALSRFSH